MIISHVWDVARPFVAWAAVAGVTWLAMHKRRKVPPAPPHSGRWDNWS